MKTTIKIILLHSTVFCFLGWNTFALAEENKKTLNTLSSAVRKLHGQEMSINYNNASSQTIADQIEATFDIKFIPDDIIKKADGTPLLPGLADHKVTFSTNQPFSAIQALNLFKTFLEAAGFSMVATSDPEIYRITSIDQANVSPLPTYINTPLEVVPDNDTRIRYVFLVTNNTPTQIKTVLDKFKSASSKAIIEIFQDLQAVIVVDKAHNVRGLVEIAKELDTTLMPESLVVKRLKLVTADEVKNLINALRQKDEAKQQPVGFRRPQTMNYFPLDVKLIPARGDVLIMLGSKEGIKRIEDFIDQYIDVEIKTRYNPLHVHPLNYGVAKQLAVLLTDLAKYGKVEGGDAAKAPSRYFSGVTIHAEEQSNSLIIRSSQEDFALLEPLIEQLDVQQPQVAIEVMILNVTIGNKRELGSQVRSRSEGKLTWQTSGFMNDRNSLPYPVQEGSYSLINNLLETVKMLNDYGTSLSGTTLVSLGKTSVWGLLGMLQQVAETKIISNPFLVTTNKYKATVALGTTRQVRTQTVTGGTVKEGGYTDITAKLLLSITPQINEYGIINLVIKVQIESFTTPESGVSTDNPELGNMDVKVVTTNANVADGEVLALGGLVKSKNSTDRLGTPLLQSIPIIGNMFDNQSTNNSRDMLIIFVAPKVIQSSGSKGNNYSVNKGNYLQQQFASFERDDARDKAHDPIQKWFFDPVEIPQTEDFLTFSKEEVFKTNVPQKSTEPIVKKTPPQKEFAAPEKPKSAQRATPTENNKKIPPHKKTNPLLKGAEASTEGQKS